MSVRITHGTEREFSAYAQAYGGDALYQLLADRQQLETRLREVAGPLIGATTLGEVAHLQPDRNIENPERYGFTGIVSLKTTGDSLTYAGKECRVLKETVRYNPDKLYMDAAEGAGLYEDEDMLAFSSAGIGWERQLLIKHFQI